LSQSELLDPLGLGQLPQLPRDADEPAFAEPWQAQAFALAIELSRRGYFIMARVDRRIGS
jgi:hypothetical protein